MYTQCPECEATMRIDSRQLRTGRGRVRCGRCLNTFDAIANLCDAPARVETGSKRAPAAPSSSEPMPEVLREDLSRMDAARRARRRTFVYGSASMLLLLAMVLQVAWFAPDEVQRRYPQARPWLERFCALSGCRLGETRAPPRVRVVSRDVRIHPRYEGALQIRLSFVNVAAYPQPFPRVQFTLFNVNGETIASRVFTPEEYLDPELVSASDMEPHRPLQIALEVLAPEQVAVSYEFQFL